MLRIAGIAVVALVAGLAVFVQIQQHILRRRAERLLADMRELQSHKSTWDDAQKIMTRWGAWGSYEGSCTQEKCIYHIYLQDSVNSFLSKHWMQIPFPGLIDFPLALIGEKEASASADFRVEKEIVAESRYELRVLVLFGNSRDPVGGYDLDGIEWQNAKGFGPNFRESRLLHPEYWIGVTGGCEGCIKFMTEFTPLAGREKIRELTNFNFSCITRWISCVKESDIMPMAWKQYREEESGRQERMEAFEQCKVPLEFFGLEEENIAIVDVISRQANRSPDNAELAARLRVVRPLKGRIEWPLNKVEDAVVYDQYIDSRKWSTSDLVAGQTFILLGEIGKDQTGKYEASLDNCGVVPYNEQNLSAIQRGIDASLARHIPER
jgi:hypothetical protein